MKVTTKLTSIKIIEDILDEEYTESGEEEQQIYDVDDEGFHFLT